MRKVKTYRVAHVTRSQPSVSSLCGPLEHKRDFHRLLIGYQKGLSYLPNPSLPYIFISTINIALNRIASVMSVRVARLLGIYDLSFGVLKHLEQDLVRSVHSQTCVRKVGGSNSVHAIIQESWISPAVRVPLDEKYGRGQPDFEF